MAHRAATLLLDLTASVSQSGRESLEAVRAALEWLPVGVLIVAADGTIVLLNGEIERTFGHHRSELIGRPVDMLMGVGWWAQRRSAAARQNAATPGLHGRRRDGSEIPIEVRLVPIPVADASFVLASVIDLSDRRHAPREPLRTDAGPTERERLEHENAYLRRELQALTGAPAIVGSSPAFRQVLDQARQAAGCDSPVLLIGETGTGKSLLAARIHEASSRRARAMVRVSCAMLTGERVHAELSGSRGGTDAGTSGINVGRLELADRSTVLLDDVAALPLEAQDALIRVLDAGGIWPRGSDQPVTLDLRVIATTGRDLTQCVAEGTFRDDLYRRLNAVRIPVPPLRERAEDVPPLVWRFVDEFSRVHGRPIDSIGRETMAALQRYDWPGNARELRNVLECAVMGARSRRLHVQVPGAATVAGGQQTLADVQRAHIKAVLAACGGEIRGERGAAARLGLTPRALDLKIAKLGL
jgi:PAS domain S-box-containing protein